MKDYLKRLNLSFDLRREADWKAIAILSKQQQKTAFIVQAILAFESNQPSHLDRKELKQILREVLSELNIIVSAPPPSQKSELPIEVFDLMDQL